MEEIQKAIGVL